MNGIHGKLPGTPRNPLKPTETQWNSTNLNRSDVISDDIQRNSYQWYDTIDLVFRSLATETRPPSHCVVLPIVVVFLSGRKKAILLLEHTDNRNLSAETIHHLAPQLWNGNGEPAAVEQPLQSFTRCLFAFRALLCRLLLSESASYY